MEPSIPGSCLSGFSFLHNEIPGLCQRSTRCEAKTLERVYNQGLRALPEMDNPVIMTTHSVIATWEGVLA